MKRLQLGQVPLAHFSLGDLVWARARSAEAAPAAEEAGGDGAGFHKKGVDLRGRPMYLDMQATTPLDPRVLDAMLPFMVESFGNPHSRTHAYGWESEAAVERAREQVAALIGADAKEIIFTSGATESNNLALKGVAHFYRAAGKRHVVTCTTDHKCVLDSARHLQAEGFDVTYLPVLPSGLVDLAVLKARRVRRRAVGVRACVCVCV